MTELELTQPLPQARPANEGAHRLAWWLNQDEARVELLAQHRAVGPAMIDRLLSGEVEPGWAMALAVEELTAGAVRGGDWARPTAKDWGDRPTWRAPELVAA